jgi:hypothetical protein
MRRLLRKTLEILDGVPVVRDEKHAGQSVVEMVIILPILLILILGLIEVGWFAQNYLNLIEAAKVGARRGPFLTSENSPLLWDEGEAATGPRSWAPYLPGALGITSNPNFEDDRRWISRGLDPISGCGAIPEEEFGFYNIISCTVREALDPLTIRNNGFDDIVISAFAVQRVRVGTDINPNANPFNSTVVYPAGTQVVVAGRYPIPANECAFTGAPPTVTERDPFDWIANGKLDWDLVTNPNGGSDVALLYELGQFIESTSSVVGYADAIDERQRGWMLLGQREIQDANGDPTGCFGSAWSVNRVEQELNINTFLLSEDERKFLPSQGLVLVEIYWRHEMLFDTMPYSPLVELWAGDPADPEDTRGVIQVWAFFPAPSAEPNIQFSIPTGG